MHRNGKSKLTNGNTTRAAAWASLALILGASAPAMAQTGTQPGTTANAAQELNIDAAIRTALASASRIESAIWDEKVAAQKATEAKLRQIPTISLSAGYTRLSDLTSTLALGPYSFELSSLDNAFSLAATMQYPVFAGFRLSESAKLAGLQARGKEIALEMTKRAVAFETQRAYWEAVRAANNVGILRENLDLSQKTMDVVSEQYNQGTAMSADLMSADTRKDQAAIDLAGAETAMKRAFIALETLVSDDGGVNETGDPSTRYRLISAPDAAPAKTGKGEPLAGDIDEKALIALALERRSETRSATLATQMAEASRRIAEAPLYPTLSVSGNYTYADPNSRVAFQTDPWKFTGTWSIGASLSYDLGGLPANLASREAQVDGVKKSQADAQRQREIVVSDVRNCLVMYRQISHDLPLVTKMLAQAKENERVTEQRLQAGTASDADLRATRLALLRSEFAIVNKEIDLQIAAADLCRAAALTDVE